MGSVVRDDAGDFCAGGDDLWDSVAGQGPLPGEVHALEWGGVTEAVNDVRKLTLWRRARCRLLGLALPANASTGPVSIIAPGFEEEYTAALAATRGRQHEAGSDVEQAV